MSNLLKHIAAGVIGGCTGTLAINYYWKTVTKLTGEDPRALTRDEPPHALDDVSVVGPHHKEGESSTAALGRIAYETITGKEPTPEQKAALSEAVHWTYGSAMGGVYAAQRDGTDGVGGLWFGTALWALGDETMVPLLGLSQGPTAFPLKQHVHRLAAHLVYGATTAFTAQTLQAALSPPHPSRWAWRAVMTYAQWRIVKATGESVWNALHRMRA